MTVEFKDDCCYNLRTGKWIAGPGVVGLSDIGNMQQRMVTAMTRVGCDNSTISNIVARYVKNRGPVGTGKYACSCNNWGPRWIENSKDGCCPGCFAWAMDHHYEVPTSKLDPNRVTTEMIESNTWGIRADVVKKLNK